MEKDHIENIFEWISSGTEIFRIEKDAVPPKHLVSYTVVIDPVQEKVLLVDHKKAKLLLPCGGHIKKNEMPLAAAKREIKEELGLTPELYFPDNIQTEAPFFVTVTRTTGISESHTDVSLWYLFREDADKSFKIECERNENEFENEFDDFHWLSFDEVLSTPTEKLDPHMHRLIRKINKFKIK